MVVKHTATADHRRYMTQLLRKGNPMATITVTADTKIERKPGAGKPRKPNEFLAVIATFDDGKVRQVECEDGDKASTLMNHIREAAASIDRTASFALVGATSVKDAKAFKFALKPKVVRNTDKSGQPTHVQFDAATPEGGVKVTKGKK